MPKIYLVFGKEKGLGTDLDVLPAVGTRYREDSEKSRTELGPCPYAGQGCKNLLGTGIRPPERRPRARGRRATSP